MIVLALFLTHLVVAMINPANSSPLSSPGPSPPAAQPFAVGLNDRGQLGDDTRDLKPTPIPMLRPWNVTVRVAAVAAGSEFTVVLAGGALYAVGDNAFGQLGDNSTTTKRLTFVPMVPAWGGAAQVTALAASCCGATSAHTVVLAGAQPYSVGGNSNGQLGDGTTTLRRFFAAMAVPWNSSAVEATAVAAGTTHTVVVAGGQLFTVGDNSHGQLGMANSNLTLLLVAGPWGSAAVTAIAASTLVTVVLAGGQLYGTGANTNGQLADGTTTSRTAFAPIPHAWGESARVTAVACGTYHTVVLAGNQLFAAGGNFWGQLGINSTVVGSLNFTAMGPTWDTSAAVGAVEAGVGHTVVLAGGKVFSVGYNYYEQLGDGSAVFQQTAFVPMKATAWDPSWSVTALAAGGWHTVLLAAPPPASPSPPPSPVSDSPSGSPSASLSAQPSLSPSISPSQSPMASPSEQPSFSPSISPSRSPSASPSALPSLSPSGSPSESSAPSPSSQPSPLRSSGPSVSPSADPSLSPSVSSSESSALSPSSQPIPSRSSGPSASVSLQFSLSPSASPSGSSAPSPSSQPSPFRSAGPSASPSAQPSLSSSVSPSRSPSAAASASPFASPSESPSLSFSALPSLSDSAGPSESPSGSPSVPPRARPPLSLPGSPSPLPGADPPGIVIDAPGSTILVSPIVGPAADPPRGPSPSPAPPPAAAWWVWLAVGLGAGGGAVAGVLAVALAAWLLWRHFAAPAGPYLEGHLAVYRPRPAPRPTPYGRSPPAPWPATAPTPQFLHYPVAA